MEAQVIPPYPVKEYDLGLIKLRETNKFPMVLDLILTKTQRVLWYQLCRHNYKNVMAKYRQPKILIAIILRLAHDV